MSTQKQPLRADDIPPNADQGAINLSSCSAPATFPTDAFPAAARRTIEEIATAYAVPDEVPGCSLLVLAGACIGRTRAIRIKKGWLEHPNLYMGLVGVSGIGKSPATKAILRPVYNLERKWEREHAQTSEVDGEGNDSDDKPQRRQLVVDDSTLEAISQALADNPRGVLWYRDELTGLILDLDRYGSKTGATKTRLMTAYDSGAWKVSRITKNRNLYIPYATLSIFGTVPPRALPRIFSDFDAATGFLPRFLFVKVSQNRPSLWTDHTISQEVTSGLRSLVDSLIGRDFDSEGDPLIVDVGLDAKQTYKKWYDRLLAKPWPGVDQQLYYAVVAKLRGQCLRIALILHCLDSVSSDRSEMSPVTAQTMERAIKLSNYLSEQQRQVWSVIRFGEDEVFSPMQLRVAKAIVDLQEEISKGMLATQRITDLVNEGVDRQFHLSKKAVGKVVTSLGLTTKHIPGANNRGACVSPDDLIRLEGVAEPFEPLGTTDNAITIN